MICWVLLMEPQYVQLNFYKMLKEGSPPPSIPSTGIGLPQIKISLRGSTALSQKSSSLRYWITNFIGCLDWSWQWYASLLHSHILQPKKQLQSVKKGTSSMQDYIEQIKSLANKVVAAVMHLLMKMISFFTCKWSSYWISSIKDLYSNPLAVWSYPRKNFELFSFVKS